MPLRAHRAQYWMPKEDEDRAVELARRAGEQLDEEHWLIAGGSRSLAGRLGRVLEQRVFDDEWGGHTPSFMADEYGPYEERSVFVVILDRSGLAAAGRTIWSPDANSPSKLEADLGFADGTLRSSLNLRATHATEGLWEVATLAVAPRARCGKVMAWMLGELRYQEGSLHAATPSVAVIARNFFRLLTAWGLPIEALAGLEPMEYLGVLSQPALISPGGSENLCRRAGFGALTEALLSRLHQTAKPPILDLSDGHVQPVVLALEELGAS